MIYDLDITIEQKLQSTPCQGRGKHCFITKCPDWIKKEFGLEGKKLILKVFHSRPLDKEKDMRDVRWGDLPRGSNPNMSVPLLEATKIQNICHFEGLAPRVYAILKVKWQNREDITREYLAQLTDDLGKKFCEKHEDAYPLYDVVKQLGELYGFKNEKTDVSMWDVLENKLIDFNTFFFDDTHYKKIAGMYMEKTKWGKRYYHRIPELGLLGSPRKMDMRIKEMELKKMNFENKDVLDIGCSGGVFLNYVLDEGARTAVGIDFQGVIEGARLMSNELGYYNAEYHGVDLLNTNTEELRKTMGVKKFDVVFYLSMFRHTHFPSFVWELCKKNGRAIIEWNNWKSEPVIREMIKEKFEILKMGRTTDHGPGKWYYVCKPR